MWEVETEAGESLMQVMNGVICIDAIIRAVIMAHRFPSALVMGIHPIAPNMNHDSLPPNVRFEIDDINLSLSAHYDQYDLVHVRMMKSGIKNMAYTMEELQKCLSPGGIIIVIDMDYDLYHANGRTKVAIARMDDDSTEDGATADGSWLARLFHGMGTVCWVQISDSTVANRDS
jgi:hypothetical protein